MAQGPGGLALMRPLIVVMIYILIQIGLQCFQGTINFLTKSNPIKFSALAISVGDQVLMLQYSIYSVISPEGCASILWKTSEKAQDAADALGITAHRLKALGVIDKIVNEPVGGAHRDYKQMAAFLKRALTDAFRQVSDLKVKDLLDRRYERLQSYGRFTDTKITSK